MCPITVAYNVLPSIVGKVDNRQRGKGKLGQREVHGSQVLSGAINNGVIGYLQVA